MANLKRYWLVDEAGFKAVVEGAAERDRWVPLGFAESGEPVATDKVWHRHDVHGGQALLPFEVSEVWAVKGWRPGPPPEPADPFNAPQTAAPAFRVLPAASLDGEATTPATKEGK